MIYNPNPKPNPPGYMDLLGQCAIAARSKFIGEKLSKCLNQRYSLPYLSMLTYSQLEDFLEWMKTEFPNNGDKS